MSQADTYRPAVLPSEAVMMPATEALPEAVMTPAQPALSPDDPAMRPSQRHQGSFSLEKLRNRTRGIPKDLNWVSTEHSSIGVPSAARAHDQPRIPPREGPASRQTFTQGAALPMLMRSAARGQHAPAPTLSAPTPAMPFQMPAQSIDAAAQPQMRGALRQVVRTAQNPSVRPVGYPNP